MGSLAHAGSPAHTGPLAHVGPLARTGGYLLPRQGSNRDRRHQCWGQGPSKGRRVHKAPKGVQASSKAGRRSGRHSLHTVLFLHWTHFPAQTQWVPKPSGCCPMGPAKPVLWSGYKPSPCRRLMAWPPAASHGRQLDYEDSDLTNRLIW